MFSGKIKELRTFEVSINKNWRISMKETGKVNESPVKVEVDEDFVPTRVVGKKSLVAQDMQPFLKIWKEHEDQEKKDDMDTAEEGAFLDEHIKEVWLTIHPYQPVEPATQNEAKRDPAIPQYDKNNRNPNWQRLEPLVLQARGRMFASLMGSKGQRLNALGELCGLEIAICEAGYRSRHTKRNAELAGLLLYNEVKTNALVLRRRSDHPSMKDSYIFSDETMRVYGLFNYYQMKASVCFGFGCLDSLLVWQDKRSKCFSDLDHALRTELDFLLVNNQDDDFNIKKFIIPSPILREQVEQYVERREKVHAESKVVAAVDSVGERDVPVFDSADLDSLRVRAAKGFSDGAKLLQLHHKNAGENKGYRSIPDFAGITDKLNELALRFPNFSDVVEVLQDDFAFLQCVDPSDFYLSPICLAGVPGIGKTAFCNALAEGIDVRLISGANIQHPMSLVGSDSRWGNSSPGRIFEALSKGYAACPILMLDEMDKLSERAMSDGLLSTLLTILEPESAKSVADESVSVKMDLSKLIVFCTCNDPNDISPILRSRMRVLNVTPPNFDQRVEIASRVHQSLVKTTKKLMELDETALYLACEGDDLRAITRAVRAGFAAALRSGSTMNEPKVVGAVVKKRMGFL
jgi:ATP-dependent Lon protease